VAANVVKCRRGWKARRHEEAVLNNVRENEEVEKSPEPHPEDAKQDSAQDEGEFKITVRKLEMPVRPRGVLAE
jgi:hypothetical protein